MIVMKRVLHLSDVHFGAADEQIALEFLKFAKKLAPDITLLSGDISMRARLDELQAGRDFFHGLPMPRLCIPGNHDIPAGNQPYDRVFRPFHRYQTAMGNDLEPELRADGLHIVSLNSTRRIGPRFNWSEGDVSRQQLDRMREKFATGQRGDLRILMLHHPLLRPSACRRAVVFSGDELRTALAMSRVDLVVCGHFHRSLIAQVGPPAGWHSILSQAPTLCSTRLKGERQGFHEIRMGEGTADVVRYQLRDNNFVEISTTPFSRDGSGWSQKTDR